MGVVYEAVDRDRSVSLALKTLRTMNAKSRLRFKNEFRALQDIRHRNLVDLGELVEDDGRLFFTMELLEGVDFLEFVRPGASRGTAASATTGTLAAVGTSLSSVEPTCATVTGSSISYSAPVLNSNAARGVLDLERLREALAQLAQGVCQLHQAGKIHRDIKPSNVMVTREGRLVLLDFGLVLDADRGTREGALEGTAAFMAPEQARGGEVGPAADWYAVGTMLYEALTGQRPFTGPTRDVLLRKQTLAPARASERSVDVPPELDDLCMRLLSLAPSLRPDGREILRVLGVATGTGSVQTGERFVGRQGELQTLHDAFAASRERGGLAVLAHGPSGVGKSALVQQFTAEIATEHPDALVLSGRCYEREFVPYKAVDDLIDSLVLHLDELPEAERRPLLPDSFPLLGHVFPVVRRLGGVTLPPDHSDAVSKPHLLRADAFAALRELLTRLGRRQPVVLAIDDLQWAGADGLALLSDVLAPPTPPSVMLLATVRTANREHLLTVDELRASLPGDVRELAVGPLSDRDARQLIEESQPGDGAPTDIEALIRETGGHPLFLGVALRHRRSDAASPATVSLAEALAARIATLRPESRSLLATLAVATKPIRQQWATTAAELAPEQLASALSELVPNHLVRTYGLRGSDLVEPYHDRVRTAMVETLDESALTSTHRRLAETLERVDGHDAEALSAHWLGAGDRERALHYTLAAVVRSERALAFDRAADQLRTALTLVDEPATRRPLHVRLGRALQHAGRGREAADAYLAGVDGAKQAERMDLQRRAGEQLLVSGHFEPGFEAMASVLSEIGERLPRTARESVTSALWQRLRLKVRGVRFKERDPSAVAPADIMRLNVFQSISDGMAMADNIRATDFQVRTLIQALRCGLPDRIARALFVEAVFRASMGGRGLAAADRISARGADIVARLDTDYLRGMEAFCHGAVAHFRGHYVDSCNHFEVAEALFRDHTTGTAWELSSVRFLLVYGLRVRGRIAEVVARYRHHTRDAQQRGDLYMESTLTRACPIVYFAADEPERALSEIERVSWLPAESGSYHLQHWYELQAAGEALLYQRDAGNATETLADDFRKLDRSLLQRVQVIRAEVTFLKGRLELASATGSARTARRIARRIAREGIPPALTWSAMIAAGACARFGDSEGLASALDRAVALADAADMELCAAAARRRRAQLGGDDAERAGREATDWMRAQGIVDPDAVTAMMLPGFD